MNPSSKSTASRTRRRRRPQSLLSATAIVAVALSTCSICPTVHARLRGHVLEHEVDVAGDLANRLPQHGSQRPGRPRNLPPHMLPPSPEERRRLIEEATLIGDRAENLTQWGSSGGVQQQGNRPSSLEQYERMLQAGSASARRPSRKNAPPQNPDEADAQAALIEARRRKKQKIKGENDKRKEENNKRKEKKNGQVQLKNNGEEAKPARQKRPGREPDKIKKRPEIWKGQKMQALQDRLDNKLKKKQDKDKNDKKDNDKKDKKDNDKDRSKKNDKKDKGKNKDKNDKSKRPRPKNDELIETQEQEKPIKLQNAKPDKVKPTINFEAIKPQLQQNNDDKPDKVKPAKNDIKPQNAKPDKVKPAKNDMKPQNAKPDKVKPAKNDMKPQNAKPDKVKPAKNIDPSMTDGKFDLGSYVSPPKESKPAPVVVQQSSPTEPDPTPNPTPRPTRAPKTPRPTPVTVADVGAQQELSAEATVEVTVPPPTNRPTKTPRPTKPKPAAVQYPAMDAVEEVVADVVDEGCNGKKWCFVSTLTDHSTLLDSFEDKSNLELKMTPLNPWEFSNAHSYGGGGMSISSGLGNDITYQVNGQTQHSKLTLVTDNKFDGGILTFRIKTSSLVLPNEAFFVEVDGNVELAPDVAARMLNNDAEEWTECSVRVGRGVHEVTWVHVYNPFGLESLPASTGYVGLWMDELRLVPFDDVSYVDTTMLEMTTSSKGMDEWKVASGGDGETVSASSPNMVNGGGSADIQFALYTPMGGTLEYTVKTSTTAPNDDFAILFNNDARPAEAIFGDMLGYKRRSIEVPGGKVLVTLSHRSNPGGYGRNVMKSLGDVGTDGKTWLQDLSFRATD